MQQVLQLISKIQNALFSSDTARDVSALACAAFEAGTEEGKRLVNQDSIVREGTAAAAVIHALSENRKIAAIKHVRTATGCSLLEGKDFVERLKLLMDIGGF